MEQPKIKSISIGNSLNSYIDVSFPDGISISISKMLDEKMEYKDKIAEMETIAAKYINLYIEEHKNDPENISEK